jgi:signal transduction histidine kinase
MRGNPFHAQPPDDRPAGGTPEQRGMRDALRLAAMREHSLLSLSEFSQNLSSSPDIYHMTDLALFNLMGHFGTSKAALWVRSETEGAAPALVRSHGIHQELTRDLAGQCVDRLMNATPTGNEPFTTRGLRFCAGEEAQTLAERAGIALFAPVPGREETLGIVALGHRIGAQPYGTVEFQSLRAALAVLGVALQNRILFARLVEYNRQLRRANEELKDIDQLKSEFMSNVNHELCTPLSVIIGYTEALIGAGAGASPDRHRQMLEVVLEEAHRLNDMLEDLLTFSEATQGLLTLELEEQEVGPCIEAFCAERRPSACERLRELVWEIQPDLPRVRFDEKRLVQIVDALVDNALKFTTEGSQIAVRVRSESQPDGTWVAIDVSDDGPGIPEDRIPVLFEPFRQADGSTTRTVGGMGIGLSFSRQLVTAMGGQIDVSSEPGQGTTVTVLLPGV